MRRSVRTALTVILMLAARAAVAGPFTATVTSSNPLIWDKYDRSTAHFEITLTNTGTSPDAFEVKSVTAPSGFTGGFGWVYSPTPTLPLPPTEGGKMHVFFTGFDQPPPVGPAAGDYVFVVTLLSTLDGTTATVNVTVRRSYPVDPASGTVQGRVTDLTTGQVISGNVALGDPNSVRVISPSLTAVVNAGAYSLSAPAGTYWLWVDAEGYQTKYVSALTVTAGQTVTRDLALEPTSVRKSSVAPAAIGDGLTPLDRAAFTPTLSRIAVVPGFGDQPSDPHNLSLFDSAGNVLWRQPFSLDPAGGVAYDVGEWTATDGGVDMTSTGSYVALASRGGAFAVYNDAGGLVWQTDRSTDDNPLIPGPLGQGLLRATEVRFSPDGTKLAAGGLAGYVYLFETSTGSLIWKFASEGQIRALAFSPDGTVVYAGSGDNSLYALRASDGAELWAAPLLFWPWEHIAVTASGTRIATGGKDGTIRVFKSDGTLAWSRDFPGFVQGFAFSPDGQHLIVNNNATGVYDFDPNGTLRWYRRDLYGFKVFMGPLGRFVGVGFNPGSIGIRVYQIDGTPVWTYTPSVTTSFRQIAFTEDGAKLAAADDRGKVNIFNSWVTGAGPTMSASPATLLFGAAKNGAAGVVTSVTPAQAVTVTFTAGTGGTWTAIPNQSWLQVVGGSGNGAGQFTVGIVNPSNVIGGSTSLTGSVTITSATASNSPRTVTITLTVTQTSTSLSPFGSFDTPAGGASGVVGAIPVTGWALDDVGVDRVEIWRNCVETIDRAAGACVAATPGGAANFVFIGRAAFLAGARPDVEAASPTSPVAYRAGWGYLMLTNALPHLTTLTREGGQGAFTLSAYAVDVEKHYTLLGTKTITLDNDHATIPFGAIDTPTQGGTIPETSAPFNNATAYPNFGWAMTQIGKCIDTASVGAYRVYIDGVVRTLTPGVNWFPGLNRSDIAAAYPGYCNTTNALAAYYINADALGLANGLHTIGWDVIDSQGNVAGVGSRFFIVSR